MPPLVLSLAWTPERGEMVATSAQPEGLFSKGICKLGAPEEFDRFKEPIARSFQLGIAMKRMDHETLKCETPQAREEFDRILNEQYARPVEWREAVTS